MREEINLAGNAAGLKKKNSPIVNASILIVCLVCLVTIGIFAHTLFLKTTLGGVVAEEEKQVQQLTRLAPQKTKILTIQERLSGIQRILNTRTQVATRFGSIAETIPDSVEISNISSTANSMIVKVESQNLQDLNNFLENRLSAILKDKQVSVKKIDITDFSLGNGGGYSTTVSFEFSK